MIIIDFSGTLHSIINAHLHFDGDVSEEKIRHVTMMALRRYRQKFMKEYGQDFIIACDAKNYWRKEIFPYYKQKRRNDRKDSEIDWNRLYKYIDTVKEEIKEHFHYPVIEVDGAEADDVIAVMTKEWVRRESHMGWPITYTKKAPVMIISRDKDLFQLQDERKLVKQYDPVDDKEKICDDPLRFRFEHTVKGDVGDGIPNILSPENSLAVGIRQKPIYQKKLDEWYQLGNDDSKSPMHSLPSDATHRFMLNYALIDFRAIPNELNDKIFREWDSQREKKNTIMKYFMKHRLTDCLSNLQDFIL